MRKLGRLPKLIDALGFITVRAANFCSGVRNISQR